MIFRAVEDADLIARVRKGDIEGFNLLVSRWEKRVFNYLLRLTGNPDDSLDLSQDVFLKAYQNIRKLDDSARFGPWLFRIAHNEAYSSFRKRRPEVAPPEFERPGFEANESFFERQPAPGMAIDLSLAVTAALDRLSPEHREAVVLKIYQGFKFDEMAEILECPVSTIKSRALHGARTARRLNWRPQKQEVPDEYKRKSRLRSRRPGPRLCIRRTRRLPSASLCSSTSPQCSDCAAELDQLRLTTAALRVLPDQ